MGFILLGPIEHPSHPTVETFVGCEVSGLGDGEVTLDEFIASWKHCDVRHSFLNPRLHESFESWDRF